MSILSSWRMWTRAGADTPPAARTETVAPSARRPVGCDAPRKLRRDLRTLALFIKIYCDGRHPDAPKEAVVLRTHDVSALAGGAVHLCPACRKLLAHAFMMRTRCPYDPKPACKHCPTHCYAPLYRAQIREVMRYSGRRLVLTGRLDYLFKLIW